MARRLSLLVHGVIIFGVVSILILLQYQFESSTVDGTSLPGSIQILLQYQFEGSTGGSPSSPAGQSKSLAMPVREHQQTASPASAGTTGGTASGPVAPMPTGEPPMATTSSPGTREGDMHSENHELLLRRMQRQIAEDPMEALLAAQAAAQRRYLGDERPIATRRDKAMVVLCTKRVTCYGLGDRFFGLMNNYLSAVLGGRAFFVLHTKPAALDAHLTTGDGDDGGVVDWHVASVRRADVRAALLRHEPCEAPACARHVIELPGVRGRRVVDAARLAAPIVQCWGNARTDIFHEAMTIAGLFPRLAAGAAPWTEAERRFWSAHTSSRLWRRLFGFGDALRADVDKLLSAAFPERYDFRSLMLCTPCVHVRTGSGLREVTRHANRRDFRTCMDKVARDVRASADARCARYRRANASNWIVLSDSSMFVDELTQQLKAAGTVVFSTTGSGPLVHAETIPLGSDAAVAGLRRAMIDFYLLSHCRYHVASLSTFDGTASIAHGAEVRRYDMETTSPCKDKPNNIGVWQRDVHAKK